MDGNYSTFLDDDMFFGWVIWSIAIWMIFKKIFLSEDFIITRLEFFAEWLEEIISSKQKKNQNIHTEIPQEEKVVDLSQPLAQKEEIKQEYIPEPDYTEKLQEKVDIISQENTSDYEDEPSDNYQEEYKPEEPSKIAIYIKNFFAENILAKIGSILVFLGVVFLMSLIWNQIPNVGKIIIGFAIGFTTYFTWIILDKKGLSWEARTLLWTWILINFLVILAWKHILWDNYSESIVVLVTFLFLILNTVFWVVTSLVYKSRTILLFSFIFAYINPFLTGGSSDNPYTLVGYSMIVSLGALFIGAKQNDNILKYSAFILGNILFLAAPFSISTEIWWITKLVASAILGFLTILNFSKKGVSNIPSVFIINYVFIILLLISGSDNSIISMTWSFISYMITILFFFGIWVWLFLKETLTSVATLLLFPILIVLGLIFSGSIALVTPALGIIVLAYLMSFNFLESTLAPAMKYLFFWILGWFIFMVNSFLSINSIELNIMSFLTVIVISFIFIFTSYYLSCRKNWEFLYSIWTLWGIFTLAPVLVASRYIPNGSMESTGDTIMRMSQNSMFNISVIAIILFALSNWILPFINKNLTQKWANIQNLLIWSIFWILFIGFQLFNYWNQYFPGVTLWLSFGWLAIIYFILSYFMMNKIWVENVKSEVSSKNIVFSYLFVSISLFSLAIALVFANNPEIISTVWLFEATILFYFYSNTKENKVFSLWIILFIIWILQLFDLHVSKWEFLFLIPFSIIFISLVLNLKYLDKQEWAGKVFHDLFHILWIWVLGALLIDIIPSTWHGWSTFWVSIFILVLWFLYSKVSSNILKIFFIVSLSIFMIDQLERLSDTLDKIDDKELSYLRILQYSAYGILTWAVVLWNKFNTSKVYNKFINGIFTVYTLFIISEFVLDIFNTTFAVTIFWAVISSILLFYGISSNKIKLRTIWLYLLTLVLGKIFLFDIWELDEAVTRVVALIAIWILLIVISTKYTKKYWNNLSWEFDFDNLIDKVPEDTSSDNSKKEDKNQSEKTVDNKSDKINTRINDIDVSNIESVKFYPNWDKAFSSKAKNLKKIVVLILNGKDSYDFSPNELIETYDFIIENYKSDLTKRDFDMINGAIHDFVTMWGKVEIKKTD